MLIRLILFVAVLGKISPVALTGDFLVAQKDGKSLCPWRSSKATQMWSQHPVPGGPLGGRKLDHVSCRDPFQPQPFWGSVKNCIRLLSYVQIVNKLYRKFCFLFLPFRMLFGSSAAEEETVFLLFFIISFTVTIGCKYIFLLQLIYLTFLIFYFCRLNCLLLKMQLRFLSVLKQKFHHLTGALPPKARLWSVFVASVPATGYH